MFKFLKDKLKEAISGINKKLEEKPKIEETKENPEFNNTRLDSEIKKQDKLEKEIVKEENLEETKLEVKEKKSFFKKIHEKVTLKKITKDEFNNLFYDIEIALLESNVAQEVVEKLKEDLEKEIIDKPIKRSDISKIIYSSFRNSLENILDLKKINLEKLIQTKKPFTILILGYNGVGKSLTISKLANYLKNKNLKVILAAGDTFRAAGSSQLVEYAKKIEVPVIKGKLGGDSCSVIFDTISSAKSKNFDVVIADTAGRIHNDKDLLNELKKIVRINKPDLNVLVIDAMTGSDVVQQVEEFNKAVNVDALIITKVDTYEKGGALLSAAYILKKPILFLGIGQNSTDIKEFNKEEIIKSLGF